MHEDHGPVRYGPPAPDSGLPVLPELAAVLAAAADRTRAEPLGGGRTLCEAARGYWDRRGLHGPRRTSWRPPATSRSSSP